jgi:hypothetical protein
MLSRAARTLPVGSYLFEPKLDGFRAIVSTENGLRVRSRRGWRMESMLPELGNLPLGVVLDGELVGDGGGPQSFPLVCRRLLHRDARVSVSFAAFDVLAADGTDMTRRPYAERRRILDGLALDGPAWTTVPSFEDGQALWAAVTARGLEGVVAKRLASLYRAGGRARRGLGQGQEPALLAPRRGTRVDARLARTRKQRPEGLVGVRHPVTLEHTSRVSRAPSLLEPLRSGGSAAPRQQWPQRPVGVRHRVTVESDKHSQESLQR